MTEFDVFAFLGRSYERVVSRVGIIYLHVVIFALCLGIPPTSFFFILFCPSAPSYRTPVNSAFHDSDVAMVDKGENVGR